jgi:hypothetical protein
MRPVWSVRFLGGGGILVLLVVHAISKSPPQMLWACHVASLAIAVGALAERPRLLAAGTLFHAGSGIPTYIIGVLATGENSVTSVLMHTVPLTVGLLELWRLGGVPRGSILPAWLLYIAAMAASYWLTEPSLNINLVHQPWPPMAGVFTQLWMSWVVNGVSSLALIAVADRLIRLWFGWLRRRRGRELAA